MHPTRPDQAFRLCFLIRELPCTAHKPDLISDGLDVDFDGLSGLAPCLTTLLALLKRLNVCKDCSSKQFRSTSRFWGTRPTSSPLQLLQWQHRLPCTVVLGPCSCIFTGTLASATDGQDVLEELPPKDSPLA